MEMVFYFGGMIDHVLVCERFAALPPDIDERARRLFAAAQAAAALVGGIAAVARTEGIVASTIGRRLNALAAQIADLIAAATAKTGLKVD